RVRSASISSRWVSVSASNSTVNASGTTGSSATISPTARSLRSASYNNSRTRSRASRRLDPVSRPPADSGGVDGSGTGDVVTRARVDLEAVADVDEQRHLHHQTGDERGR